MKSKQVRDLQIGDVLHPSNATVIEKPYDQVRTPKGKTNLTIRYPEHNGRPAYNKAVVWGKDTTITLKDNAATAAG